MWIDDDDEMDMAAAMAGEPSLGGDGGGDDDDEMDMAAAMAGEPSLGGDGGGDDDDEMDMAAAMAGEPSLGGDGGGDDDGVDFDENDMMAAINAEQGSSGSDPNTPETLGGTRIVGLTSAVQDIGVDITAVLGVAEMKVSNLLKIGRGAVIELNKRVGDTVDLQVAGQSVACGDVVVVEDKLAVSITETFKKNISS